MSGIYRTIRDEIESIWTANWPNPSVPVYWREADADPIPDPSVVPNWLRNEIDFGRERVRAYGGGLGANERVKFGSVIIRVFADRGALNDDTALDLLSDAEAVFRSRRTTDLSFIGEMSGFDEDAGIDPPHEDGNWFMRGSLVVFEYRFVG